MRRRLPLLLLLASLPGCATIVHGNSQNLTVTTNPPGAACRLEREGVALGVVAPTPGTVRIEKSKNDIVVTCTRDGFDATTRRHASEFGGTTFGNVIVGGLIGVAVDAASGANFPYHPEVVLNLQPPGAPPVQQPPTPSSTTSDTGTGTGASHLGVTGAAPTPEPPPPPTPKP